MRNTGCGTKGGAEELSAQKNKDQDNDPLSPPPVDRGSNPTVNWHKEKRSNQTHESLTDPMARLYKKTRGAEARLGYLGHVVTGNRNGLWWMCD